MMIYDDLLFIKLCIYVIIELWDHFNQLNFENIYSITSIAIAPYYGAVNFL
jgi:hypothetical protein